VHLVRLKSQNKSPIIQGRSTLDDATIIDFTGRDAVTVPLTELLRKGARELLKAAVEAERDAFLAEFAERRTSDGRAAVDRCAGGYPIARAVVDLNLLILPPLLDAAGSTACVI